MRRHGREGVTGEERSHDRVARLLALLRLFHQRRVLTREEIIVELGAWYGPHPDRAVRRDIAALAGRDVDELDHPPDGPPPRGFDVRHDRASDRFSLVASDLMPRLAEEEQETLQTVRQALGSDPLLGRRLESLLERFRHDGTYPIQPSVWLNLGLATDYTTHAGTLLRLVQAAQGQRSVTFEYHSPKEVESRRHRKVDVYPLELVDGHYYFDGYHHEVGAFITYRVDRIVPSSLRILPDYGARREHAKPLVTVSYWLSPHLAAGGVSRRLRDQHEEPSSGGGVIVTGKARSLFHVRRLLLSYGPLARVLSPPELVAQMQDDIRAMSQVYEIVPAVAADQRPIESQR